MPRETKTPVLVVGAGPVGLALAGDLGWRGIPCVLIEQSDGSIYQPRMDLVGIRTMEFCRRWGLVGAVEASPYPRDLPQDNVYVTSLAAPTNVTFRCPGRGGLQDKGRAYRFIILGPEGTWSTIVAINGTDQWRFSIIGGAEPRDYGTEEIHRLIRRAVGRDFDFEILTVMPWVRRELVAERYGEGRVFMAGDAVHMLSPTGAFGMNTGIQDAVDLSWKLAATLQGWGGEQLLASYDAERRPVGHRNVREAANN